MQLERDIVALQRLRSSIVRHHKENGRAALSAVDNLIAILVKLRDVPSRSNAA